MSELKSHPVAELFPLLRDEEFRELVESIRSEGLRDPITMHPDGTILDGRNRYFACRAAGVEPRFERWDGQGSEIAFVTARNLVRRHLTTGQRAMIAGKLATLKLGNVQAQRRGGDSSPALSNKEAGKLMNVSPDSVKHAKVVLSRGTPEERAMVEGGDVKVTGVARQIKRGISPEERNAARKRRLAEAGRNPERIQRQRANAQIWGRVRDAVDHLNNLPRAEDVVAIVRAHDKSGMVDARLETALAWLKEFENEWRRNREDAA